MADTIRLGTRGSKLALIQTNLVAQALRAASPGLEIETKVIQTKGDTNFSPIPLDTIGKAWFTAEIEDALVKGEIDLAIHSLKDVPPDSPEGLLVTPVLKRADPRDVLLSSNKKGIKGLKTGAKIGTDSSRRKAQLLAIRRDIVVESIRGNVETRIKKMHDGHYDAIVLAAAGLERLELLKQAAQFFYIDDFVPAPGQGVLAAQMRADDRRMIELVQNIQDAATLAEVTAEQAFTDVVGGGCKSPVGACGRLKGDKLILVGMLSDHDGRTIMRDSEFGHRKEAKAIGEKLGARMIAAFKNA